MIAGWYAAVSFMLIIYVVYQQLENHFISPVIMSRTVNLSPLLVLLSALVGVELAGLVGALLAIPVAGAIQVAIRDLWDDRQQRLKPVPTVGADEIPITEMPMTGMPTTGMPITGIPANPPPDPRATGTA